MELQGSIGTLRVSVRIRDNAAGLWSLVGEHTGGRQAVPGPEVPFIVNYINEVHDTATCNPHSTVRSPILVTLTRERTSARS